MNLKTLINTYRCEYAENLIESTNLPLSVIAMDSGFQSIRSFNRIFKDTIGKTPSSIRKL
jgi:AraC-like DNA-binding protein